MIKNHSTNLPSNIEVSDNNLGWIWIIVAIVVVAAGIISIAIIYNKRKKMRN